MKFDKGSNRQPPSPDLVFNLECSIGAVKSK
jgi:hypothetical protein